MQHLIQINGTKAVKYGMKAENWLRRGQNTGKSSSENRMNATPNSITPLGAGRLTGVGKCLIFKKWQANPAGVFWGIFNSEGGEMIGRGGF